VGQVPGHAQGGEERERFAEEAAGDCFGLGDGGEAGALVPLSEQGVIVGERVELLFAEAEVEAVSFLGERREQLGSVVIGGRL